MNTSYNYLPAMGTASITHLQSAMQQNPIYSQSWTIGDQVVLPAGIPAGAWVTCGNQTMQLAPVPASQDKRRRALLLLISL